MDQSSRHHVAAAAGTASKLDAVPSSEQLNIRRRSSLSRRRTGEDRVAVEQCFRDLMTAESQWLASLNAVKTDRFDVAGLVVENLRLSGELFFLAHGLKPAVLFSNLTGDEAMDYVQRLLLPSGLLQDAPLPFPYSAAEPSKEAISPSDRLIHLCGPFYALRIGQVESPQSDLTDHVLVFHRPLSLLAAPEALKVLLHSVKNAAPEAGKAHVTERQMAALLDYPVALPEEPLEANSPNEATDMGQDSPGRASRKRVRLMSPPFVESPTLEIAYTARHFNGAPFVVLTSYGAPESALPAVRKHFARYQLELEDILHVQLVMIPL